MTHIIECGNEWIIYWQISVNVESFFSFIHFFSPRLSSIRFAATKQRSNLRQANVTKAHKNRLSFMFKEWEVAKSGVNFCWLEKLPQVSLLHESMHKMMRFYVQLKSWWSSSRVAEEVQMTQHIEHCAHWSNSFQIHQGPNSYAIPLFTLSSATSSFGSKRNQPSMQHHKITINASKATLLHKYLKITIIQRVFNMETGQFLFFTCQWLTAIHKAANGFSNFFESLT